MIATKMTMNTTPPTIPPMTGARGNLLPLPPELVCIGPVEEDGLPDEEVEETRPVVVEGVPSWVEDWRARGQNGEAGRGNLSIHS